MLKRRLTIFAAIAALIGVFVYACIPIYVTEPFFSLSLSDPKELINEIFLIHYPMRSIVVRTPVAVDQAGHIYILGGKEGTVRAIVIDEHGGIQRTVILRLKKPLHWNRRSTIDWCHLFSVSPSGNRLWTACRDEKKGRPIWRVTAHDRNGQGQVDWEFKGSIWLLFASDENGVYAVNPYQEAFRFVIGQKQPQRFKMPFEIVHFKDGWFWSSGPLNYLLVRMGQPEQEEFEAWKGIAKWSPQKGAQIVLKSKKLCIGSIIWIDKQGNFYTFGAEHSFLSFLSQIKLLDKLFRALGLSSEHWKLCEVLRILSPKCEIIDSIVLPAVIRPSKGEKLEYGQLVKADETGIYLEVERVSEPREYRIVKIVKKPRWQVWWEGLGKAIGK